MIKGACAPFKRFHPLVGRMIWLNQGKIIFLLLEARFIELLRQKGWDWIITIGIFQLIQLY